MCNWWIISINVFIKNGWFSFFDRPRQNERSSGFPFLIFHTRLRLRQWYLCKYGNFQHAHPTREISTTRPNIQICINTFVLSRYIYWRLTLLVCALHFRLCVTSHSCFSFICDICCLKKITKIERKIQFFDCRLEFCDQKAAFLGPYHFSLLLYTQSVFFFLNVRI